MRKMLMIAVLTVMVALTAACGGGNTTGSAPAFTEEDILVQTEQQLRLGTVFPTGAEVVRCIAAGFNPVTDLWEVVCNLYSDRGFLQTNKYTVSDKDGKLVQ